MNSPFFTLLTRDLRLAARSGGRMIGAVMRMIETGGRKNPSTTTIDSIAASSAQRDSCMSTIACATDWLICR